MLKIKLYYGYIDEATLNANKHPEEQQKDLIDLIYEMSFMPEICIYSNSPYVINMLTLLEAYTSKNIPDDKKLYPCISIQVMHFEINESGAKVEGKYYDGMIDDDNLLNNALDKSNQLYSDLQELEQRLNNENKQ